MRRRTALPLGVDVGAARTRVACAELGDDGAPVLVAVATRPTGDDPAAAIAAAREELRTRERRCVLALSAPDAVLRSVAFPAMKPRERMRAARFDAARYVDFARDGAIRVIPDRAGRCVVGIARRSALDARVAAARRAGLRPIAVDDAAFALLRAFGDADAVVDIGERATVLDDTPQSRFQRCASSQPAAPLFPAALAASLTIDLASAEERKRTIGLGGAAEHARDALVDALASALVAHRSASADEVALRRADRQRRAPLRPRRTRSNARSRFRRASERWTSRAGAAHYPPDVVRAASPDWALAYGLALWGAGR